MGEPQLFQQLADPVRRARLLDLRSHVEPILEKELLPHFTDHGPRHGDRVARLAEKLAEPIQKTSAALSDDELFVLFAACYLHDFAMHVESTGALASTKEGLVGLGFGAGSWTGLPEVTRQEVTRRYHHRMAAELVLASKHAAHPAIGLQLDENDNPAAIAMVCEAHGEEYGSRRYDELTRDSGAIRCSIVAAVLRIADILDESCVRAEPNVRRSLMLDVASNVHWFRHYYTRNVQVNPERHAITLTFEFPTSRRADYEKLVPVLQVPEIAREVGNHTPLLAALGGAWFVEHVVGQAPYSSLDEMPPEVLAAMARQIHEHRARDARDRKEQELTSFDELAPILVRQASESSESAQSPEVYLGLMVRVAKDLRALGAARAAWNALFGPVRRLSSLVPADQRLEAGLLLGDLGLNCGFDDIATQVLAELRPLVAGLEGQHSQRELFGRLMATALLRTGAHSDARAFLTSQIQSGEEREAACASAQLAELTLLLGEVSPLADERALDGASGD